ncbi:hypothetical protein [Sediminibacterium sp. TEGAF015]|uniref:hypothetical protein n=1 Tax=Sediminibacterium sp. TEGAF015 TaxID=575378 RepID=UPI002206E662|nr:hypothetical protein [Sediminibacterium sp. TEGAF015]BDQ12774.1 hypothetical protein TEGAF0_19910 [Sediminibacterium sp. TEGAF015]
MRKRSTISIFLQKLNAAFFVLALIWLTISTPFVMVKQHDHQACTNIDWPIDNGGEEESANPLNNTSEEKPHSTNGFLEEYLHATDAIITLGFTSVAHGHSLHPEGYQAFHRELLVPPPNLA